MPNKVKSAAIIVNWREPHMTLRAAESLLQQSSPLDRIMIVDNGSGDDSSEILAQSLEQYDRCELICLPENLGFGSGNNAALRTLLSDGFDRIWLFNNDAIADTYCHEHLQNKMQNDPNIGSVGSNISDSKDSENQHIGHYYDLKSLSAKKIYDEALLTQKAYSWTTAASLYLRCDVLREIGIFDEAFFMYWEDADLCIRMQKAGYQLSFAHEAKVQHRAGTSSDAIPIQRYLWHLKSQLYLHQKHISPTMAARFSIQSKYLLKALIDGDIKRAITLFKATLN